MKTGTFLTIIACSLLISSCGGRNAKKQPAGEPGRTASATTVNVADSLKTVPGASSIMTEEYVGLLPAADGPGINFDLSLTHYETTDHGVYKLIMTYIDAEGAGKDKAFTTYGRYAAFTGIPEDNQARYITLTPFEGEQPELNLLIDKENALTMLDTGKNRIVSCHNYTLVKKGNKAE